MTTDTARKTNRYRLGPNAVEVLEQKCGGDAQVFDHELERLARIEKQYSRMEANHEQLVNSFEAITTKLTASVQSQGQLIEATSRLHDKLDERTAQLVTMYHHTSGLIGHRLTEGSERKRLLGQFHELFERIEKQVEQITLLVKERIREARGHLEDARREGLDMVQIAEPTVRVEADKSERDSAAQRDRGRER